MTRLWLLDFDGTLVDSEKAIKSCYLKVGQELIPERCSYIKTMTIGPTLDESSKMILGKEKQFLLDKFKRRFKLHYDEKIIFETQKYPNVESTITKLISQGDQLCIVTNKRSNPTHKLLSYYGWTNYFLWVACLDDFPDLNNKAELIAIKKINRVKYNEIFFVGDTLNDFNAADLNQIKFIRALYGYGGSENWTDKKIFNQISSFEELLNF